MDLFSAFLDNFGNKIQKAYEDKSSNEKSFWCFTKEIKTNFFVHPD